MNSRITRDLESLRDRFSGELLLNSTQRRIYATDASVYQSLPLAVAVAKTESDILKLIRLANKHRIGLIPRTAGTSLAGQVVGNGIVVDVSKYFTRIIEINESESWVRVQPGVIRDRLNAVLVERGLHFAPETSTSNRAMIGGMLGNNSCGANSIVFGTTRDHVLEVTGFLSDGTRTTLGPISQSAWEIKVASDNGLESRIYQQLNRILSSPENRAEIRRCFPGSGVKRRNTGYALDLLLDSQPFGGDQELNLATLVAGSEGTLFLATEIKLNCVATPPENVNLVCVHFKTLRDALLATRWSMEHQPHRCELIDDLIVEGARRNRKQARHLGFVRGNPAAILMIEFRDRNPASAERQASQLVFDLQSRNLGFHHPILKQEAADQAWQVRRAGLGVASNHPGDVKPVTVIEDAAVDLDQLPDFIAEVDERLSQRYGLRCVHYGHAGAGELHLRPNLNLKSPADRTRFRQIAEDVARLVKKYGGSLSGEHGDGWLRSEFLRFMLGNKCHEWIEQIKHVWDPNHIFNPGKIMDAPQMDQSLRLTTTVEPQPDTIFRFGSGGLLGAVEMCSGLGDCRKTHLSGGTMCPSYMATRDEQDTTRARANLLRQILTERRVDQVPLGSHEVKEILDLCLSCKGCKSECPSNVDLARIKAEFMQGYYDVHGTPWKIRLLARLPGLLRCGSWAPGIANWINTSQFVSPFVKRLLGIHAGRSLPRLPAYTLRHWFAKRRRPSPDVVKSNVLFFCDEFTNYLDVSAGIAAIELLKHSVTRSGWPKRLTADAPACPADCFGTGKKLQSGTSAGWQTR